MNRFLSALLIALTVLALTGAAEQNLTPLRIVTFNAEILTAPGVRAGSLQRFRFDYARGKHIERVADIVETLSPDILNLVEVTSREAVEGIVAILHEKGMTDYRGYHIENDDSFTGMDVALITRLEPDVVEGQTIRHFFSQDKDPTWRQAFDYIGYNGDNRKGYTSVSRNATYCFTVAGHKIGFLGLHLKSNPQDDYANAKRSAESAVAVRIIRSEIASRGYMPVVLGDINDYDPDVPDRDDTRGPSTDVLANLKDYDPDRPGPELINVASHMPRQADRYTSHWDWNENGAHDIQDVYTMIDHILLPKELDPYVKRAFVSRCVGVETSDHYPVIVDLALPPADAGVAAK